MLRPHRALRPTLLRCSRAFSTRGEPRQHGNEDDRALSLARTVARLATGHAAPWPADVEHALARLAPRLSRPALLRALDLVHPPAAALRLFRWASTALPFPLDDDRAYYKLLLVLSRSRTLVPARDLLLSLPRAALRDRHFNVLIRAHARAGRLRDAASLFRDMSSLGVLPSVFSYNSLIAALLRRGRTRSAGRLYVDMRRTGVAPDVCTFNTLIRGFCLNSMVDEGFRIFREMGRRGCAPDVVTYNTLLDGLCRAGKLDIARNLLDGMRKKESGLTPNVVSYTTLIRGHCMRLQAEAAAGLFEEMVALGLKPNKITYNTLIQGFCEARRMDLVKLLLEQMAEGGAEAGFRPDTCTFNTLMTAYCNAGSVRGALKLFIRMMELHAKPDSATYSILIQCLCRSGEYERAEKLVDEMLEKEVLGKKQSCVPLMAAYNLIFDILCRNGKAEKAGRLFRQLMERSATVDIAAFKTLIVGHCKEGDLRKGHELLVSMVRRDLKPDFETFRTLIYSSLEREKMGFAWKALEKMLGSGLRPSTDTFHLVLAGLLKKDVYAKEAADLVAVMLQRKVRPNIDLSTNVIFCQFRNGFNKRALEILGVLYENGFCVDMEKLVGFLCNDQKFLEARELLFFCLEKHHNLDAKSFDKVVNGLCTTGRASEAFGLFYEMTDKISKLSNFTCFDELKVALEAEAKFQEADFVSKRMIHPVKG